MQIELNASLDDAMDAADRIQGNGTQYARAP